MTFLEIHPGVYWSQPFEAKSDTPSSSSPQAVTKPRRPIPTQPKPTNNQALAPQFMNPRSSSSDLVHLGQGGGVGEVAGLRRRLARPDERAGEQRYQDARRDE
ncbi:MAG: hypothetical protein AAF471_03310, partial [Myxococcota bacterium]